MRLPFFSKRSQEPTRDPLDPRFWESFPNFFAGGQAVNAVRAEQIAAVYACKTAISESIAMLPCSLMSEASEQKKIKETRHPLFDLLHDAPNPWMDSFEYFEVVSNSMLDTGNSYSYVTRSRTGSVLRLTPLDATRMTPRMEDVNRLVYRYTDASGQTVDYAPENIFHVKYRSKDGLLGRTPIQIASESFAHTLALQEHGLKTFQNGAFLSGFLQAPHAFKDDEQRKNFMDSFRKVLGAGNAGKFGLLEQGVDFKPFSQNNRDAEFLGLKQFSVLEIARIYRMPPHMIQSLEKGASYSSIEQMSIAFVQYTIQPWVTRLERAIKRQLLSSDSEKDLFVRFNISALIRGDLLSRTTAVVQKLQAGLATINEGRSLLDDNAVDSPIGDEILLSHNLRPASVVLAEAKTGPVPADTVQNESTANRNIRFERLFRDLWGRVVRREQKLIADAQRKGNFEIWANDWIPKHQEFVRETFASAIEAFDIRSRPYSDAYIEDYISDLKNSLSAGYVRDDDSLTRACDMLNFCVIRGRIDEGR